MTYKEAKPFLKDGMKVKVIYCGHCGLNDCNHTGKAIIQHSEAIKFNGQSCSLMNGDEPEILTQEDGVTPWGDDKHAPFKIGDRVKIIKNNTNNNWSNKPIGYEFTIAKLFSSAMGGFWCREYENKSTGVHDSLLEKIEDDQKVTLCSYCALPLTGVYMTLSNLKGKFHNNCFLNYPNFNEYKFNSSLGETELPKKGFIMTAVDKLKRLALSKEDRILQDEGLEDENKQMTEQAEDMMDEELRQELWKSRRSEIAKSLLELKKEEK